MVLAQIFRNRVLDVHITIPLTSLTRTNMKTTQQVSKNNPYTIDRGEGNRSNPYTIDRGEGNRSNPYIIDRGEGN